MNLSIISSNPQDLQKLETSLILENKNFLNQVIDICLIKSIDYLKNNHQNKECHLWSVQGAHSGFFSCRFEDAGGGEEKFKSVCWYWFPGTSHLCQLFKEKDQNIVFINTPGQEAKNLSLLWGSHAQEWLTRYEAAHQKSNLEKEIKPTFSKENTLRL